VTKDQLAGTPQWGDATLLSSQGSWSTMSEGRHKACKWERALDAIGAGNPGTIAREIDWVIKYQLIEQYRARHDLPLSAPQVAQADLAHHDIDSRRGLYYQLRRSGKVGSTARDIDIFEARATRAGPGRYRHTG
jgi:proteasome accessory factor A